MVRFSLFVLRVVILIVMSFTSYGLARKINNNIIDQSSLLALKFYITSDPHNMLTTNWTIEHSICSWIGVSCDPGFNRVSALDISNMELVGRIPPEIGNLSSLISLRMDGNYFHGSIPPSIFNMSTLEVLVLWNNSLLSSLPADMCKHSLHKLKTLDISHNKLYGEIPSSLGKCSKLENIYLSYNKIVGDVPKEIGNLTELQNLCLYHNNLSGVIPKEIKNLSKLVELYLFGNYLSGLLPPTLFNMSSLETMDLSHNDFSGGIPEKIYNLNNLWNLDLRNNKLTGLLSTAISNMSSLNFIYLSDNSFRGNIPPELFTATFSVIDLSNNLLQGSIPPQIERSINLGYLLLQNNHLSGEIPSSICNLTSLQYLHLTNNNLEGSIPRCFGNISKSLVGLMLKDNRLHGSIPSTFPNDCALQSLDLNNNQFGGMVPPTLSNCRQLGLVDIGNNDIQDSFPIWMGTLDELRVLVLRSNKFYGPLLLPLKANAPFSKLQVFDIAHNAFTGPLPQRYVNNFRAMIDVKEEKTDESLSFGVYSESMEFVIKGLEQPFQKILTTFTTIDMSKNNFAGSIPKSMGRLNSLRYLNLSHNNLTGHIPSSFGNMSMLESLDLSSNNLDGEIPSELTNLTSLAKLNISMNHLSGRIPQTRQFNTFENDSYVGNQGLCGTPLTNKCEEDKSVEITDSQEDDEYGFFDGFTWQVVALGYGSGFVVGIGMGYFTLRYGWPRWVVELFFGVNYSTRRRRST